MNREAFIDIIRTSVVQRDSDAEPITLRKGQRLGKGWLFDFRSVLLDPEWLDAYAEIFWEHYADRYPFQVGGMESTAIALVAAIVMKGKERGTPVSGFFIRKSRKKDGRMRVVEGTLVEHPVILVDDLINTGTSLMKAMTTLASGGVAVADIFSIVAFRNRDAYSFLEQKGSRVCSLTTLEDFGLALHETESSPLREPHKILWHFKAPHPSMHHVTEKSAPATDTERIYFGTDNGTFYALSKENGDVVWKHAVGRDERTKGIFSDPCVLNGEVFFGAYDGNVYALGAERGETKWVYRDADWVGSSPVAVEEIGLLFVGLEFSLPEKRGGIVALSLQSGEATWTDDFAEYVHCSPLYVRETGCVYIADNSGSVRSYDARTGTKQWQVQISGAVKSSFSYDAKRKLLLFGAFDGHLHALSAREGTPVFAYKTLEPIFSTPLVHKELVFIASLDKTLYGIELSTGKKRWSVRTEGRIFASPKMIDGSLFIGSNDGRLYEIDAESGHTISTQQFSERIVNAISYDAAEKRMFVPTVANEIYCLERVSASQ